MKITWLGQAGLIIETEGVTVLVDPYLSDSVKEVQPLFWRRVPVPDAFFGLRPQIIVLTHDHLDHTDPETLKHFLGDFSSVCVLASHKAWERVRAFGGEGNNYVSFNRGTVWTERGIRFRAVKAEHSDPYAIGVVMEAEGKTLYITGDTLYNEGIFPELPQKTDAVFLPVNGVGNNMNMTDGEAFCRRIGAVAVPMHCGLFDEKKLSDFAYEPKVVPEFFKEIPLFL